MAMGENIKLICVHPQMIPTTSKISKDQNMRGEFFNLSNTESIPLSKFSWLRQLYHNFSTLKK